MLTKMMKLGLAAVGGVAVVAAVALGRSRGTHIATIPAGTALVATLDEAVSTEHARPGDVVRLHTIAPIRLDGGRTEIPSGVVVQATVTESKGGGRIAGAPGGHVVLPAGQTVRIHLDGPVTVAYHPRSERSNAD